MDKVKSFIRNYIPIICIIILLGYIFFSNVLIMYKEYTLLELSKTMIYFGIGGIILYIVNKVINKIKIDIYDVLILGLIICGVISSIYAIDSNVSLFGFRGRYEGLVQLCLYYILFLNCKNISNKKCKLILVITMIVIGCLQAIYGILQFMDIEFLFGNEIIRNRFYSTGFEMNPNFFGTLMIISFSLSLGLYYFKKGIWKFILTLISSIILFFGLLCSGAMSAMVALVFLIVFLVILLFILKVNKKEIIFKSIMVIVSFVACYMIFNKYDNGYYMKQVMKTTDEVTNTLVGNSQDIYGSGRIHIWKRTLEIVPDNLFTGVGIDNFYYAFGDKRLIDIKSGYAVDKAHNEYLQKLITEGIFSLVIYLILLLIIFIKSGYKIIKYKKGNYLFVVSFLTFISYCVQAFFNISVITVAPYFYIVMGIVCSYLVGDNNERDEC